MESVDGVDRKRRFREMGWEADNINVNGEAVVLDCLIGISDVRRPVKPIHKTIWCDVARVFPARDITQTGALRALERRT
jgi:hypothetical protein